MKISPRNSNNEDCIPEASLQKDQAQGKLPHKEFLNRRKDMLIHVMQYTTRWGYWVVFYIGVILLIAWGSVAANPHSIENIAPVATTFIRILLVVVPITATTYFLYDFLNAIFSKELFYYPGRVFWRISSEWFMKIMTLIIALAIIVTVEQVIFARKICVGLSCPITLPSSMVDHMKMPQPAKK